MNSIRSVWANSAAATFVLFIGFACGAQTSEPNQPGASSPTIIDGSGGSSDNSIDTGTSTSTGIDTDTDGQDGGEPPGVQGSPPKITGVRYFVSPFGRGVSTQRQSPGAVTNTILKICDGTASQLAGGDAVVFLDGEYRTSSFDLKFPPDTNQPGHGGFAIAMVNRQCTGPSYVHLLADNRYAAVIRNDVNWTNHSGGFNLRNSSYIWVEGFRIEGALQAAVPFDSGISVGYGSHHAVVRYNQISLVGGGGIVVNNSSHIRIENNEVVGAGQWHPYCASGISFFEAENRLGFPDDENGYSNYVIGNKVSGTRARFQCDADANLSNGIASYDGNCIVLDDFSKYNYGQRTLIENNLCVDNGGGGVHLFNSGNTDIVNNTIFASGQVSSEGGLSILCTNAVVPTRNVRFANNLVHTLSGTALTATDFGIGCLGNIEHRHNIFVNRNPDSSNIKGATVALTQDAKRLDDCASNWNLESVTTSEAGWVNAAINGAASGFRLTDSAIGLNRGSCVVTPKASVDFEGAVRKNGAQVDVGAFER